MSEQAAGNPVSDLLNEADAAFLRRDADGAWRIRLLMNSHSHRVEPLA